MLRNWVLNEGMELESRTLILRSWLAVEIEVQEKSFVNYLHLFFFFKLIC